MSRTVKSLIKGASVLLFWLAVWEITALIIDLEFVFPRLSDTFVALILLLGEGDFWISIALSLGRIILGFVIGVILGIALSLLCNLSSVVNSVISPIMTVIKATPVASFILVLWFIIGSGSVPIAIACLMVMPIIWQNLSDGYKATDKNLEEVCLVFSIDYLTKLRILIIPTLAKFLLPAMLSASGLAWKAGIAAEIIAYTENSLGRDILNAKNSFESAEMFAITVVVALLSIGIERGIKILLKRAERL